MRQIKKISLISLVIVSAIFWIVVAIFIYFPSILNVVFKDIDPVDDSDLSLQNITVSKEENAYYDLIQIDKNLKVSTEEAKLIDDHLVGKTWEKKFVDDILSKNESAIQNFETASQKPKFQDPAFANPANITFETINSVDFNIVRILKTAKLVSLKAMNLGGEGKEVEAFEEALKPVEVGQKMQNSQAPLIHYLLGIALKRTGLETQQILLGKTNLKPDILERYVGKFEEYKKNEEGFKTAFKIENHIQVGAIDSVVSGDEREVEDTSGGSGFLDKSLFEKRRVKSDFYFQPNKTKAILVEYNRKQIKNADMLCSTSRVEEEKVEKYKPPSKIGFFITENAIGKTLHDILVVAISGMNNKRCEDDLQVSATQILFALKAYKIDKGNLPSTLDELVPTYMSQVFVDPFDGKAIKYNPEKKIIYSVGKDNIDSGGSDSDRYTMNEPTFKINF